MRLKVDRGVCDAMTRAAQKAVPLEACGLCGGAEGRVTQLYEIANTDASGEHYSMAPVEQFAAVKDMREKGLRLLAIWHSHPETPARMSDEDLRLAYTPEAVYLIVSLATPAAPDIRGFSVRDGRAELVEIVVVDGQGSENP